MAKTRHSHQLLVTPILIALNVVIFGITAFQASPASGEQSLFTAWVLYPPAVETGQWWRILTSGFLHVNPLHLGLNMIALYVLGRDLEPVFGRTRYLAVYLVSLLGGGVAVYLFGAGNVATAGASGAVYGLMGALVIVLIRLRLSPGVVVGIIALNLAISIGLPGISLLGHLGGLIVGTGLTAALIYAPAARRNQWQVGVVIACVLILGMLALIGSL